MKKLPVAKIAALFVLAALLLCGAASGEADSPGVVAVITSPKCPMESITMKELQDIFLKRRTHIEGLDIEPINRESDSELRIAFDSAVLDMSSDESKKYWISMRIKGEGGPPKTLSSSLAVKRFVEKMDGEQVSTFGISYVAIDELDDNVKVLKVEGIEPPESPDANSKYPLIIK